MEEIVSIFLFTLSFLAAGLCIQYIIAKKFEEIAFKKGYDQSIHSFAMCFWLGIVGYLYVIALPDLTLQRLLRQQNNAPGPANSIPQQVTYPQQEYRPTATSPVISAPVAPQAPQTFSAPAAAPQAAAQHSAPAPQKTVVKRVVCKVCGCTKSANAPCPICGSTQNSD